MKVAEPKNNKTRNDFDLNTVLNSITSIGDLLIYKSDESPYFGSKTKGQTYVPKVNTTVDKGSLDEAPPSIVKKNLLKREIDEYMYAPGMGLVSITP